jgi:hypothetical protein
MFEKCVNYFFAQQDVHALMLFCSASINSNLCVEI